MTGGNWLAVDISTAPEALEALTNFLFELGSAGCQEQVDKVTAFFSGEFVQDDLDRRVRNYLKGLSEVTTPGTWTIEWRTIPDRDWNAEWKKHFKPEVISRRFTVKPTWEELAEAKTDFVLEIDPKQAFGTGAHATTALMLQLLENQAVTGKDVLDVGTGTGILALAAYKLGAARIAAIDIDSIAIATAEENAVQNIGLSHDISFHAGMLQNLPEIGYFDIILANITRRVLLEQLASFEHHSKEHCRLMFSGILAEELNQVNTALQQHGVFKIEREIYRDEWLALLLTKGI